MSKFMSFFVTSFVDDYGDTEYMPTTAGYTALVLLMVLLLGLGFAVFGGRKKMSAKQLAFSAIAIALAVVTSTFCKIIHMPMGGSVTLFSMLFITLIGYWFGVGTGLCCALAYGILQLIIDPYILTLPQMLVDYIFAFGALGLSGLYTRKHKGAFSLQISYLIGVLGRYFFAFLSGWIFFGTYASYYGFKSGVVYSLAYNACYIFAEAGITLVVITIPPVTKGLKAITDMACAERN